MLYRTLINNVLTFTDYRSFVCAHEEGGSLQDLKTTSRSFFQTHVNTFLSELLIDKITSLRYDLCMPKMNAVNSTMMSWGREGAKVGDIAKTAWSESNANMKDDVGHSQESKSQPEPAGTNVTQKESGPFSMKIIESIPGYAQLDETYVDNHNIKSQKHKSHASFARRLIKSASEIIITRKEPKTKKKRPYSLDNDSMILEMQSKCTEWRQKRTRSQKVRQLLCGCFGLGPKIYDDIDSWVIIEIKNN